MRCVTLDWSDDQSLTHSGFLWPAKLPDSPVSIYSPPLEIDSIMSGDDEIADIELLRITWQSLSTGYFITQPINNGWQMPPDSKAYRERNPRSRPVRTEHEQDEKYREIPPFRTCPCTSKGFAGGHSGAVRRAMADAVLLHCDVVHSGQSLLRSA